MLPLYLIVIYLVINTNASRLASVRAHNVTKREGDVGDLFPDWVPFKNKHGEELGEFVQVSKPTPKKRLALPVNFILRAVAEPEGDDYYDKGQGETDGDEYYEKKEWSDTNRAATENKDQNHAELSDIDGVVEIITRRPNAVVEALKKPKQSPMLINPDDENVLRILNAKEKSTPRSESKLNNNNKYEDDKDYQEVISDKENQVKNEQNENEAKKTSILDSVDELKVRHAEEQREINEKLKEEAIYNEEREKDIPAGLRHKDKYAENVLKPIKKSPAYEEYVDSESTEEKYSSIEKTTKPTITTTKTKTPKREKHFESGPLSVFKNPQLFMIYDEEDQQMNTTPSPKSKTRVTKNQRNSKKFSSKYKSINKKRPVNESISLVPDEGTGKEGEPTLFFPKKIKKKGRKLKKVTTVAADSTVATDSTVAESVSANTTNKLTTPIVPDTTGFSSIASDTTAESAVASTDSINLPTNIATVTDAIAASTDDKAETKPDNYHQEKGHGKEYSSSHEEEHDEGGKKAYEGVHKESKSSKGHHEKEDHLNKYDDHGGVDKHSEEESGHYGAHHHEEHGKKHAKYEESGKHSKGHSTKGSHDIHKKEEYEKKVEFFEEEGDSSEEEKHGGHNHEHGHAKGGHFKTGNYNAGHHHHAKGDSGHFGKGGHVQVSKGHKKAEGEDGHGRRGQDYAQKGGNESGKKWVYYHGHPAKTANLVRIDKRSGNYYPSPQWYG